MRTLFRFPWPPELPVGASFLLVEDDIWAAACWMKVF